ncbi:hypothetical protein MUK42_23416 [Musa troglodytarum]|uniref:Uncharacterized protein n=1 Tax=Musa troglodytarum TaxID=320322 RepID=A0A9E7JET4_9LILI|nr:hypothetical protein MUK42_23416 [Musa troglodytarum]
MMTLMPVSCWKKGGNEDDCELWPVLPLQDVGPGALHALGLIVGRHQVVILGLDVVGAADLAEHGIVFLVETALDEGVGGIGQDERANGDDGGRDCGQP